MTIPADTVRLDRAEPAHGRPAAASRIASVVWRRLLLLPAVGFLFLMTIFPTIYSLWMSMQQYNLSRPDLAHFVGLRNYGQLLSDDIFWKAVRITLIFSCLGARAASSCSASSSPTSSTASGAA